MAIRRPNPLWWVYYQYGGRLPERYREWVLHDGTCRTWLARVVVRGLVMVAPVVAALFLVFGLLSGSWYLALGAVVLGVLVSVRYALSYSVESVDSRLARHGYPLGHGTATRQAAHEQEAAASAARYRAAWRNQPED
jgi:Family of unknown function (DUF5313)